MFGAGPGDQLAKKSGFSTQMDTSTKSAAARPGGPGVASSPPRSQLHSEEEASTDSDIRPFGSLEGGLLELCVGKNERAAEEVRDPEEDIEVVLQPPIPETSRAGTRHVLVTGRWL